MILVLPEKVYIQNPDYVWKDLKEDIVLLNPKTGDYFGLNPVAASFWKQLDGDTAEIDIITRLLDEFEIDRETLEEDIGELVSKLIENGLISRKES